MTATNAQLRTLVGRELQILPANRTSLNAADAALVDEYHAGIRAFLISDELCYWADGSIPEEVKIPLAYIVSEACKTCWNKDAYSKGELGMLMLRRVVASRPSGEPTMAEFY